MPLTELFKSGSANEIIAELKSKRTTEHPDAEQAKKAIDPKVSIHAAQAGCDGCCKDTTKKRFSQRINRESPY